MMSTIMLFLIGLCWGSFLNVIACGLMQERSSLLRRSQCPRCNHVLYWYDLIPIFSWIILRGKCCYCRNAISWLYPTIEITTGFAVAALFMMVPAQYLFPYFLFFSALIITIRTDIEYMLISQLTSLYLVPVGIICSIMHGIPISPIMSIVGAIGGYLFLYLIAALFAMRVHKEGLGRGDMELMACIGAFTGPMGCWTSLFIGSVAGACFGLLYMYAMQVRESVKIPFGPFLALGAMLYVLYNALFTSSIFLI